MMMSQPYPSLPILLVDDELQWLESFSFTLEYNAGINNIICCQHSDQVMKLLQQQAVSMIVLDMTMPPPTGEELLPLISQNHPEVPVVVLSGLNQLDTAVTCMKLGASDYFTKTTEVSHLLAGLKRLLQQQELQRELKILKNGLLTTELEHPEVFENIVTCSPVMHSVFKYLEAISTSREPVLITGESGVGKELIAKAVHQLSSPKGPWVAVNVAGLDDNAFSDTLFGHVRGAFTGAERNREGMIARANGGVVFLDEIGDLPLTAQVKLLRLLQEQEYYPLGSDTPRRVEARVVCATNCDLVQKQIEGTFRKDLYYRLCTHLVDLPPLRNRREDIPLLLSYFLKLAATNMDKKVPTCPAQLTMLLNTYSFPGNIREFRAMIFDALSQYTQGIMSMEVFRNAIGLSDQCLANNDAELESDIISSSFPEKLPTLELVASQLIDEAMNRAQGNQSIAARMLGISQPALSRRLKKK